MVSNSGCKWAAVHDYSISKLDEETDNPAWDMASP